MDTQLSEPATDLMAKLRDLAKRFREYGERPIPEEPEAQRARMRAGVRLMDDGLPALSEVSDLIRRSAAPDAAAVATELAEVISVYRQMRDKMDETATP